MEGRRPGKTKYLTSSALPGPLLPPAPGLHSVYVKHFVKCLLRTQPKSENSSSLVQPQHLAPLSPQLVITCSICPPQIKYELLEGRNHVLIISVFPVPGTHRRHLINGWWMNEVSTPNQRSICSRNIQVVGVPSQPIYLALVTSRQQDCLGTCEMLPEPHLLHPSVGSVPQAKLYEGLRADQNHTRNSLEKQTENIHFFSLS